jgi:preprotein translocase subunit SecY
MFRSFLNIFRIPELRNKVLFTFFMLMIYRIGYHVPLPGLDQSKIAAAAKNTDQNSAAGRFADYVAIFSGGNLQQGTIFGLGIMPYISASIIFQLLGTVVPALEKMQKEGESGRKKIQEWSRYATVPLCMLQAMFWLTTMNGAGAQSNLLPMFQRRAMATLFFSMSLIALTAGSIFLMWLGEQIDEYGLGNGVSLIILAGIVARIPAAISELVAGYSSGNQGTTGLHQITLGKILFLVLCFVFVVTGSILITQAQRRIPVQQAKHTRGRRIYGGGKQYLPLRVNHGGVMPIIFAQSLMLLPSTAFIWLREHTVATKGVVQAPIVVWLHTAFDWLAAQFSPGNYMNVITEAAMIYFFAYFWTTVQFQPKEMANQLRDYGSFIPGLRPGKRTSDYLEKVMMRITFVGAAFLCVVAVVPVTATTLMQIPQNITSFLGGTGLLIVVSVALDMVQRIEANLLMRNYGGFLSGSGGGKGKRIKGRQY